MGCFTRIGCLTVGALLGALALACLLATRPVGPRYDDGVFVYDVAGRERRVPISDAAARSFDAKVNGQIPQSALVEAVTAGVPISEEEMNSRVAEELVRRPVSSNGATVERVFIRFTSAGPKAFIYTSVRGVDVVLSSDLIFRVERGKVEVELRDPHAGKLPVGFLLLPAVLRAANDLTGLEDTIAIVIPPQVRGFRYEEGRLRVQINPLAP